MPALRDDIDPDDLLEYSVVFSDGLNSMSATFGNVMRDISRIMRNAYGAASVAVVPGGGTYGMEAIARQFVQVAGDGDPEWLVRYRWSQIIEAGGRAAPPCWRPVRPPTRRMPRSPRSRLTTSWRGYARRPTSSSARMSRPRPG